MYIGKIIKIFEKIVNLENTKGKFWLKKKKWNETFETCLPQKKKSVNRHLKIFIKIKNKSFTIVRQIFKHMI